MIVGIQSILDALPSRVVRLVGGRRLRQRDNHLVRRVAARVADPLNPRIMNARAIHRLANMILIRRLIERHAHLRAALEVDAQRNVVPEQNAQHAERRKRSGKTQGSTTSSRANRYSLYETVPATLLNPQRQPPKASAISRNLNRQRRAAFLLLQDRVEDHARYQHRGKQVGKQTEGQRHRKPPHRTRTKQEQDHRRNDRRHVRIDDRDPRMRKPLLHRRRRRLAGPQLFANALKDQHIRVHAHTDRQNHARDSRQRQRRSRDSP